MRSISKKLSSKIKNCTWIANGGTMKHIGNNKFDTGEGSNIKRIGLKDIVDVNLLQEIQDNFSQVTKLAAITVDYKGEPVTEYSNFTRFCQKFREEEICKNICFRSDAHGGVEAARSQKPFIYTCHAGLVDFAIPIVFEGQFLGSILAGQVKISDYNYKKTLPYDQELVEERFEDPELQMYYDEVEAITSNELEGAADLMYIMSNYIVEQAFNHIIQEELNEKNSRLIKEMEVRMALEKNLRESELQLLQSQVNPHFLFNVLNTINSLAMIEKANKTSEMIYSLSEMLRYTIKNKMHYMVTLEQEIDYNNKYLQIQKVRLGNQIEFCININDSFNELKVPFMIIQPLVSNAINHGLFDKGAGGKLSIISDEDEDNVYITVKDNGKGMTKETIKSLQNGTYESKKSRSTGTGLTTVEKRLIHRYGENYRLHIESEMNKGTKITVKIPKEQ